MAQKTRQNGNRKKENKELEIKIEEIKKKISQLEKEVLGSTEKIEKLKKERALKSDKLVQIEKEIEEETSKTEDIKNHISKLDLKKSKIELELNQVIDKMWEEYELTPNNVGEIEKIENPNKVQKDKFLKEVEEYDKSKAYKSRRY